MFAAQINKPLMFEKANWCTILKSKPGGTYEITICSLSDTVKTQMSQEIVYSRLYSYWK